MQEQASFLENSAGVGHDGPVIALGSSMIDRPAERSLILPLVWLAPTPTDVADYDILRRYRDGSRLV
jgi:hypothetical protein